MINCVIPSQSHPPRSPPNHLAVETGMRLQEVFDLIWRDIDFNKRCIHIRKSKTDKSSYEGRDLVLNSLFPDQVDPKPSVFCAVQIHASLGGSMESVYSRRPLYAKLVRHDWRRGCRWRKQPTFGTTMY